MVGVLGETLRPEQLLQMCHGVKVTGWLLGQGHCFKVIVSKGPENKS